MKTRVTIDTGQICGCSSADETYQVFKGIPYAAPPVKELRWRAPLPVKEWEGELDCTRFKTIFPQSIPEGMYQKEFYDEEIPDMSEDSLYLNVWTAAKEKDEKLPVMIYLHGGAYKNGWSHEKTMDGSAYCKRGVILVTIEYRMGIFGFMAHPELSRESENHVSGNYGLLDQIQALKWVQKNISAFGGNPDNVTVFGSSAGACCIYDLMCSPLAQGLFHKAILSSGDGISGEGHELSLSDAEKIGEEICKSIDAASIEEMRRLSAMDLFQKTELFNTMEYPIRSYVFQHIVPCVDGYVLKETSVQSLKKGDFIDIPCLVGFVADEMSDYVLDDQGEYQMVSWKEGTLKFAEKMKDNKKSPIYVYEFSRELPGDDSGAFHASELWYVFGTIHHCWRPMTEEDERLSNRIVDEISSFAHSGKIAGDEHETWKEYQSNTDVMQWKI